MSKYIEFRPKKELLSNRYKIYRLEGYTKHGTTFITSRKVVRRDVSPEELQDVLYKLDSTKKL